MSIKLNRNIKPELIAAPKGHVLPVTAWYDAPSKSVRATDGKMAVSIPVEANGEETGELPTEALKAFRKNAPEGQQDLEITTTADTISCAGITMPRQENDGKGKPPDIDVVVPKRIPDNAEGATIIRLDVKLLAKLATAMGVEVVRLQIRGPTDAIRVDPIGLGSKPPVPDAVGVIMPVTV